MRILITGAPGSGTTTLGRYVATCWDASFFDTDSYFWLPSEPPFKYLREPGIRNLLLRLDLDCSEEAIVAGSVDGWGQLIEDSFSMIVFLTLPTEVRIERLLARETSNYGRADPEFLRWAAQYEQGYMEGRSRSNQEKWLSQRRCEILRIEGDLTVEERSARILDALSAQTEA